MLLFSMYFIYTKATSCNKLKIAGQVNFLLLWFVFFVAVGLFFGFFFKQKGINSVL